MGWSNYLIVPELKLVVKISRHIQFEDYEEKALDSIFNDHDDFASMEPCKKVTDLSVKDLGTMMKAYDDLMSIYCIGDPVELLMYWLKKKGIDYEIKHEDDIDLNTLEELGFTIMDN